MTVTVILSVAAKVALEVAAPAYRMCSVSGAARALLACPVYVVGKIKSALMPRAPDR